MWFRPRPPPVYTSAHGPRRTRQAGHRRVHLDRRPSQGVRGRHRRRRHRPRDRARRVLHAARPLGMRQDHHAAHAGRASSSPPTDRSSSTASTSPRPPHTSGRSTRSSRATRCSRTSTSSATSPTGCAGARTSTRARGRRASPRRSTSSSSADTASATPTSCRAGQQQRVALARALVLEPAVLLLDEPLGALDAKLRHSLRAELTSLQREVGITFVFVTHDQEEALEMSNRLVVMDGGRIMQLGTPEEVYREPLTEFVADFLGVANLLDVECDAGQRDQARRPLRRVRARGPGSAGHGRVRAVPSSGRSASSWRRPGSPAPTGCRRWSTARSSSARPRRSRSGCRTAPCCSPSSRTTRMRDDLVSGQPVTVQLPPESLRVLASSRDAAPVAVGDGLPRTPRRQPRSSAVVGQVLQHDPSVHRACVPAARRRRGSGRGTTPPAAATRAR